MLYEFGFAIEYVQQYSNTFFHKKIHGNADPEDIHANAQGLIAFSACWLVIIGIAYLWKLVIAKPVKADVVAEVQVSDTTGARPELQKPATKK